MPKIAKNKKSTKQKLSPEERSQVAKDRWAKRRSETVPTFDRETELGRKQIDAAIEGIPVSPNEKDLNPDSGVYSISTETPITSTSVVTVSTPPYPTEQVFRKNPDGSLTEITGEIDNGQGTTVAAAVPNTTPAPQLTPVRAPKQKRYTGPKEFSVALKAAEGRLAKAIVERAEAAGKMAMLQAEIPSLVQIISALKGQQNIPAAPYDLSGMVPSAYQAPIPQPYQTPQSPLAAIQAAQPAAPVSRASGGAMQFGPEVFGALEGPEDDDIDKFITGPAAAGGGWIGG